MTNAANRLRSAKAPVMSAGVIAANISWNAGEQDERDRRPRSLVDREADVHEPDEVEAADEAEAADGVGREREREPDEDPDDADEGQPEEAVHDRGEDVLAPDEPAVEEGEARQHDHHEGRRDEQPGGVPAVDRDLFRRERRGRKGRCKRQPANHPVHDPSHSPHPPGRRNADEPGSPGCLPGVSRARAGCRVGQAEAKRMRLGCREPPFRRAGLRDGGGTTAWPEGTIVTLDLASGVAYGQRAHQVCAGQRSWSTKANPG